MFRTRALWPSLAMLFLSVAPLPTSTVVVAAPTWYANGAGGFNPNVADFYQHQNWLEAGGNNWQSTGGWCYQLAYADVFYDLTKQGYAGLLPADITDPAKWFDTAYKPANVNASGIAVLHDAMAGKTIQSYLDSKGHKADDATAPLIANEFKVDGNGKVTYKTPAPKMGDPDIVTSAAAFDFYDLKTRAGDSLTLELKGGTTPLRASSSDQGRWWTNFHQIAGAGLDKATKTIYVADPDTNRGSTLDKAGWPDIAKFPGDPPASATSMGLKTTATDPIPLPTAPVIGTIGSYDTFYAGFIFDDKNKVKGDANNARYTGTVLNLIETISAPKGKLTAAAVVPGGAATTVAINTGGNYVDAIYLAPSQSVLADPQFSSLFTFTLPSDPMGLLSSWSTTVTPFDPFGNERLYGGVRFDLTSGSPLAPSDLALATLGTISDFSLSGYELLLHYVGDDSSLWNPEVIGSSLNSTKLSIEQTVIPEPASGILATIAFAAIGRRRSSKAAA